MQKKGSVSTTGKASCTAVTHFSHGQIPIGFDPLLQVDESDGHLPVVHLGWVRIEREDLEFDRVEGVDPDGRLRVGVQVLVELFKYG